MSHFCFQFRASGITSPPEDFERLPGFRVELKWFPVQRKQAAVPRQQPGRPRLRALFFQAAANQILHPNDLISFSPSEGKDGKATMKSEFGLFDLLKVTLKKKWFIPKERMTFVPEILFSLAKLVSADVTGVLTQTGRKGKKDKTTN